MGKRKAVESSGDEEDDSPLRMTASSPDRPLQTARRSGKKAKSKAHSDGESEEEEEKPIKKSKAKKDKVRAAKPPSIKKPKIPTLDEDDADDVKTGVTTEGERFVDLGKKKRATVRMFKGTKYLDIREFYGDEDDLKPGKKGVSINQEQWESLKKSSDVIDSFFARLKS